MTGTTAPVALTSSISPSPPRLAPELLTVVENPSILEEALARASTLPLACTSGQLRAVDHGLLQLAVTQGYQCAMPATSTPPACRCRHSAPVPRRRTRDHGRHHRPDSGKHTLSRPLRCTATRPQQHGAGPRPARRRPHRLPEHDAVLSHLPATEEASAPTSRGIDPRERTHG
ncbi:DUF2399 domain-containing protein [Streptomyces sp. NPDC002688]|uniref:DUF2399 domain-containing protein n=1 Tax=Streptomyces sp. NPDC002688 TaxID=3154423 RepID=UPI0033193934